MGRTVARAEREAPWIGAPTTVVLDAELSAFCEAAYPRLLGALILQCGDPATAEELAQDTLVRIIDRWDDVRSMDYPMSWAHRVAYNLAASHFRRRSAERRAYRRQAARREAEWTDDAADAADAVAIRRAVARLPHRQRCAVVLRYFGDLPVAAVAESMGVTPGTVKVLTSRALKALRSDLGVADLRLSDAHETGGARVDPRTLAERAEVRRRARRAGAAVTGVIAVLLAVVVGLQVYDRPAVPEILTPDELLDLSWEPAATHDFLPVTNAFLPTRPLVEAAGWLWTAETDGDTVLVQRGQDGAATGRTVPMAAADRHLCYLEATPDALLLAVLCDDVEGRSPTGVGLVDPHTTTVTAVVDRPSWSAAGDTVEYADGAIWTAGTELVRVDPDTAAADSLPLPEGTRARALTSGHGSLWLTTEALPDTPESVAGEVLRIDPADGQVSARIPVGDAAASEGAPAAVSYAPWAIAAGLDAIWVELAGEGRIARIDPSTNEVTAHVAVLAASTSGQSPTGIGRNAPLVAAGQLWAHTSDRVHLLDASRGTTIATVVAPVQDPSHVSGAMVTSTGDVWFGDWERDVALHVPRTTRTEPAAR